MENLITTNLQWHFGAKKIKAKHTNRLTGKTEAKTLCMHVHKIQRVTTPTTNMYDSLPTDDLEAYGDYHQPWKLDSGASGHYCGPRTGVRNRQRKRNGIKVAVADGNNMNQVEEGIAPFNKLPAAAADVQIFPHMPNALISAGKIVQAGHKVILDDPIATVINKLTNEVVMEAKFDPHSSTWNLYPDGPVQYEFTEAQKVKPLGLGVQREE